MTTGLLLLRILLAGLLLGHALQKLRGWFGGAGPAGTSAVFERRGFAPSTQLATTTGQTHTDGGPHR
ncbi:DoxX family membrane protein [Streptomyces shenzhenensis]|uniref:DoxX family membrane protein n=1 Tax=Streptomyces shenzhenensis TaxID=943815 RepID=UPI003815D467